jgi:capsular polysaccharide biosynthesis protein
VLFSKLQPVVYRSSAKLQVIPARYDYGLTMAADLLLRQFALQIQTPDMAWQVINDLKLDVTPEKFLEKVVVSPVPEDFLIQIDVDDADPAQAQAIADKLAQAYVTYHREQSLDVDKQDRIEIQVLEGAKYGWVHWPQTRTLAVAGGILGILVGGIIVFILEWLESDIIRVPEDVERFTGLVVLGSIPAIASENPSSDTNVSGWRRWLRRGR